MKKLKIVVLALVFLKLGTLQGQEESKTNKTRFAGLHFGVVHPIFATNKDDTKTIADKDLCRWFSYWSHL